MNMYRSRGQHGDSRRGGRGTFAPNTSKVPVKGLFSDGIWKCNCDPRLPAQHFQTKNGGKNHGRWFYTCQHPQPKRCDFFLWDDEAKVREAAAVLHNSRTEPGIPSAPVTPNQSSAVMTTTGAGLMTPGTEKKYQGWDGDQDIRMIDSSTASKVRGNGTPGLMNEPVRGKDETQTTSATEEGDDDTFYDWPASDEEEFEKVADKASGNNLPIQRIIPGPLPETPRKVVKTEALMTPGKRRFDEENSVPENKEYPTPVTGRREDDVFAIPREVKSDSSGLFAAKLAGLNNPNETPTPIRYKDVPFGTNSELASEILASLATHAVALPADAEQAVKAICNRHVLFTRGILKGRDVSRAIVKSKEEKVIALQVEIEGLKGERETDRAVIRHLRRNMALRKEATR